MQPKAGNRKVEGQGAPGDGLRLLASSAFALEGEAYKLITFLNQTLKDYGIIFGLSKDTQGFRVTVYRSESRGSSDN